MQEKFKILETFCKNVSARQALDDLIVKFNKKFSKLSGRQDELSCEYLSELELLFSKLETELNVSYEEFWLYFSMDRASGRKVSTNVFKDRALSIKIDNQLLSHALAKFDLTGESISYSYSKGEKKLSKFLENNSYLFPASTKKYLEEKHKKRNIYQIGRVDNNFKARILISKMPDKFKITQNKDYFKSILLEDNYDNKLESFTSKFYFYQALKIKYWDSYCEVENYTVFMRDVYTELLVNFKNNCKDKYCVQTFNVLFNDTEILAELINSTITTICHSNSLFMLYFVADFNQRKDLKKTILRALQNDSRTNLVKFSHLSDEEKETHFEQSLRHFLIDFPIFKKYLIDNDFLTLDNENCAIVA